MDTTQWPEALVKFGIEDPFEPARTAPRMRQALRNATPHMDVKAPDLEAVEDFAIPGPAGDIPVRLYIPFGSEGPAPLTLYMHGGGYVIGDLDTHDRECRRLAAHSGARLMAIDYRLAPEHPFPAAIEDTLAAFDWLVSDEGQTRAGADPQRIAVAGDSAGGGLAAMLTQARREQIRFQLLIYPLLQLVERRKPRLKALEGHLLAAFTLEKIALAYLPDPELAKDPRVSPLFESDLAGLPKTHIFAAELDPLLDEGKAYRDRLIALGLPVDYTLGKGLPHGYFNLTAVLPGAKALVDAAAVALGDGLRG
ncbi:MAG: lipase [Oceanicaulis sp.]|uniref:Alpha/beta hydrolase n=1 Tax=Maricaulis virginensis TaxID=144022 RepID=A0A9W6IN14_9PROT|nr:alpha/beta hydrolase [Maricaulis virginensis]MAC38566.1 lipase [Oceanicaulis sp.]MBI74225.1 lipase [Oceanicaulis sp.]GLK52050.1 alpha/beta hydrolase [Maricaulis virginensis]|tara:strand:+ start:179 stop:1105 length:927 start_codon:yes stop_codon:yes gene_type:complete